MRGKVTSAGERKGWLAVILIILALRTAMLVAARQIVVSKGRECGAAVLLGSASAMHVVLVVKGQYDPGRRFQCSADLT